MFEKGDLVVYGNIGVCEVADVLTPDFCLPGTERLYYVLVPRGQSGEIFVPTDTAGLLRGVITAEEAERLIDRIPTMEAKAFHSPVLQELNAHYKQALQAHTCESLIQLTMSIYAKKQHRLSNNQKIGAVDESYMKRGENLLFGELGAALGMEPERVPAYIAGRVRRGKA